MKTILLLWTVAILVSGCATGEPEIGVAVYVGDEMVRPYRPTPALVVDEHFPRTAKFAAIDIHCHWSIDEDPAALIAAMDDLGVHAAINLSGGFGDDLEAMLRRFHDAAPGRLLIFANIDFSRIDEPDFGTRMAAELRAAQARGVAGVKIFKSLGLTHKDASGAVIAVDDPRIDPIWAACGELGLPVLIHSGDPRPFFEPIDEDNERWMQLCRHPDWSFHGEAFPDLDVVVAQRDRVFVRHRGTTFIAAHVASHADDLTAASILLDAHPNVVMDISGRVGALGRQPYSARDFIMKYTDRVLYGTDRFPGRADQPRERIYFRFLETRDQYFLYYDHPFPPAGEWRIHGIGLPDDVLRRVYRDNAARVLGLAE